MGARFARRACELQDQAGYTIGSWIDMCLSTTVRGQGNPLSTRQARLPRHQTTFLHTQRVFSPLSGCRADRYLTACSVIEVRSNGVLFSDCFKVSPPLLLASLVNRPLTNCSTGSHRVLVMYTPSAAVGKGSVHQTNYWPLPLPQLSILDSHL